MSKKTRVLILGMDPKLLSTVSEKINSSRPVEVSYYTDLKDFLSASIKTKPDIVGISFSFPHKSVTQFPRVFRLALSIPVITFGEDEGIKTRKLLSASSAEFKISGVLTAHNLWMKLVNFEKQEEEKLKAKNAEKDGEPTLEVDGPNTEEKNNTVHLKNKQDSTTVASDQGTMLSSLFAALNENDNEESIKDKLNIIKSSSATNYKKETPNHINTSDMGKDSESSDYSDNHGLISGGTSIGESNDDNASSLSSSSGFSLGDGDGDGASAGIMVGNDGLTQNEIDNSNVIPFNSKKTDNNSSSSNGFDPSGQLAGTSAAKQNKTESEDEEKNKEEENKSEEKPKFGKVKLADEKEVKAREAQKAREKNEKDSQKKQNLLIESCEFALERVFAARKREEPRDFDTQSIHTFLIDMGNYKGLLSLANSFNSDVEAFILNDFKDLIAENVRNNGVSIEISSSFQVKADVVNYEATVTEFSDFLIKHEEESGRQQVVSFIQRESITPSLEASDKPEMYLVDIKVIPPKTIVNFDAFLFLPKNNRFVRYLKEGRSLSLEQAKRHTEVLKNNKLYLPKNHKQKFIQFFIQNTIDWELSIAQKQEASGS